jgi:hypothetical protein
MERHIITDSTNFPIQPDHINTKRHFAEAFDNMETEISAHYVVKLCQELGTWGPFTMEQIEEIYRKAGLRDGFTFNRLIEPEEVFANAAEEFGRMATHANFFPRDPFMASMSYAMSHGKPETVAKGGGWIVLGADKKYRVTDDFVNRCYKSSPACKIPEAVKVIG